MRRKAEAGCGEFGKKCATVRVTQVRHLFWRPIRRFSSSFSRNLASPTSSIRPFLPSFGTDGDSLVLLSLSLSSLRYVGTRRRLPCVQRILMQLSSFAEANPARRAVWNGWRTDCSDPSAKPLSLSLLAFLRSMCN